MDIDVSLLLHATTANLERLARAIGVTPTPLRDESVYRLVLCRELVRRIRVEHAADSAAESGCRG